MRNGNGEAQRPDLDAPMAAGDVIETVRTALDVVRGHMSETARAQGEAMSTMSRHLLDLLSQQQDALLDLRQRVQALEAERDAAHSTRPSVSPMTGAKP
jgi:hypothetical protein